MATLAGVAESIDPAILVDGTYLNHRGNDSSVSYLGAGERVRMCALGEDGVEFVDSALAPVAATPTSVDSSSPSFCTTGATGTCSSAGQNCSAGDTENCSSVGQGTCSTDGAGAECSAQAGQHCSSNAVGEFCSADTNGGECSGHSTGATCTAGGFDGECSTDGTGTCTDLGNGNEAFCSADGGEEAACSVFASAPPGTMCTAEDPNQCSVKDVPGQGAGPKGQCSVFQTGFGGPTFGPTVNQPEPGVWCVVPNP